MDIFAIFDENYQLFWTFRLLYFRWTFGSEDENRDGRLRTIQDRIYDVSCIFRWIFASLNYFTVLDITTGIISITAAIRTF